MRTLLPALVVAFVAVWVAGPAAAETYDNATLVNLLRRVDATGAFQPLYE